MTRAPRKPPPPRAGGDPRATGALCCSPWPSAYPVGAVIRSLCSTARRSSRFLGVYTRSLRIELFGELAQFPRRHAISGSFSKFATIVSALAKCGSVGFHAVTAICRNLRSALASGRSISAMRRKLPLAPGLNECPLSDSAELPGKGCHGAKRPPLTRPGPHRLLTTNQRLLGSSTCVHHFS